MANSEVSFLSCYYSAWVKKILEDCDNEAFEVAHIKLLQQSGRSALWNICTDLGFQSFGVPGQACWILESYLYSLVEKCAEIHEPTLRESMIKNVQKRFYVIVTGCILIAVKSISASIFINAQVIRLSLMCKGIKLSVDDINTTELDIYASLKYKIPLWTSVDIALFLATKLNVPSDKLRGIALIVDVAEYYKGVIDNEVRRTSCLPPQFRRSGGNVVRSLHLAAGAVAAASQLSRSSDVAEMLAVIVRVPTTYIQSLSDIILSQVRNRPKCNELMLKRKRNVF